MVSGLRTRPTETQLKGFRKRVRAFIAEHAPPIEAREGHRAPVDAAQESLLRAWFAGLFDAGFIGADWPVEYGGRPDHHPLHDRIVSEEILRARAPRPVEQVNLAAHVLLHFGSEAQKRAYLPSIRSSEHVWCQLLSEPDAGSDIAAIRCRAALQQRRHMACRRPENLDHRRPLGGHGFGIGSHGSVVGAPSGAVGVTRAVVGSGSRGASYSHDRRCYRGQRGVPDGVRLPAERDRRGGPGLVDNHAGLGLRAVRHRRQRDTAGTVDRRFRCLARHVHVHGAPALKAGDVREQVAEFAVEVEVAKAFIDDHVERLISGDEKPGDGSIAKLSFAETYHRVAAYGAELASSVTVRGGSRCLRKRNSGYVNAGCGRVLTRFRVAARR